MPEQQNIEWKSSWRDEYLKWICGFANAKGGKIIIGKNDKGDITDLPDYKKLMEELPNKIQNHLGIICEINLHEKNKKYFIEIEVDPYPYPISYKGKYYYRSGSTKQQLKGSALSKFLLNKQGKKWDSVPVMNVSVTDLQESTFEIFKNKAIKSNRLDHGILNLTNLSLLENLELIEGDYIKRAAILLFHPKPEKFFTGAYIKIGYFKSDDDLRYQDEVHGNLFNQIEKALDLLFTKYLKAHIRFEEKIIFWNEGQLPENWKVEKLTVNHPSKPFNPFVANTLFRAGYIEAWGRGTLKIIKECLKRNLPKPNYFYDFSGFIVEFYRYTVSGLLTKGLKESLAKIIIYVQDKGAITNTEVQKLCNVSKRSVSMYLSELEGDYLIKKGTTGKGTSYVLKGQ
ncbi:MAG: RNA-binding domain-containing protein [bacterium]